MDQSGWVARERCQELLAHDKASSALQEIVDTKKLLRSKIGT